MSLKKLCRCGKIIEYREAHCSKCKKQLQQERAASNRHYDKSVRNKRTTSFYNSTEWIETREYILKKYKGIDLYAFFIDKKIIYANTVHHIEELKGSWSRRLDIKNLFPLSNSNHNKIHGMYEKDKEGTQKMLFKLLERWEEEYGQKRFN